MIFLDGVGIGKNDSEINPFVKFDFQFFKEFFSNVPTLRNARIVNKHASIFPINATMGIAGLPQSGTGQTSIFCGINASKLIGKHFGPYPYSTLKPIIAEKNLFTVLLKKNFRVNFSNAYPQRFFDYLQTGRKTLTVTTLSYQSADQKLRDVNDVINQRAITAEITNKIWNEKLGYNLPIRTPQQQGKLFWKISSEFHFNLFEYFLTDHAGHSMDFDFAHRVLSNFEGFLEGILANFDHSKSILLIVSDHGNIEDLSVKTHTRNPALGIVVGKYHELFSKNIKSLKDIKENILQYFENS